jgi:hypothetical protein
MSRDRVADVTLGALGGVEMKPELDSADLRMVRIARVVVVGVVAIVLGFLGAVTYSDAVVRAAAETGMRAGYVQSVECGARVWKPRP